MTNPEPTNFLWPQMSQMHEGRLVMRATGYTVEGSHWTGVREFTSSDPSWEFWRWLHANRAVMPPILNEVSLPVLLAFASALPSDALLSVPEDGVYLNRECVGPFAQEAIDRLLRELNGAEVVSFRHTDGSGGPIGFMSLFCHGMAEVFIYRSGRCRFFGAIGECEGGISLYIRSFLKNLQR